METLLTVVPERLANEELLDLEQERTRSFFLTGGHDLSLEISFSHVVRNGTAKGFQVPPGTFSTAGELEIFFLSSSVQSPGSGL